MHPALEKLLILQARDQAVAQLTAELERTPREEKMLEDQQAVARAGLEAFKNEVRQFETQRKQLEMEVNTKQSTMNRYKQQQLETRKNEEFSALGHEIERVQKEIAALEDRELELMEHFEQGQRELAVRQTQLKEQETKIAQQRAHLEQKKATLQTRLEKTREEQAQAAAQIEEDIVVRYRRILQSKKDAAIVPINHGNCGGCHMKLTSATVLYAKGGEQLASCENCGRLLYWQGD